MPIVSVLTVFHRDTPFLRPAIASVLGQTLTDLEVVLVDNGAGLSADDLGELGRDSRLRWVRLPRNLGIPGGHNHGVAAARGEFIALLDYDDLAMPTRLERQVARLREDPALGLVSSLAESIDEQGKVIAREFSLVSRAAQQAYVRFTAPVVTPAYTGRRTVFAQFPYREEFPFAADFDFLSRAIEAYPAEAVPEVLLRYRNHPGQTTWQKSAAIEEQCGAIRLMAARRQAGRDEGFASVCQQLGASLSAAEHSLRWAKVAFAEGLYPLAAYQARRSLKLNRAIARWPFVTATAVRAIGRARGAERRSALRLFLLGPVRALRLQPG